MPPKRQTKNSSGESASATQEDKQVMMSAESIEEILDRRLKKQFDQIHDLSNQFSKTTKSDLEGIKKSQEFLSSKFDSLISSMDDLPSQNDELRKQNDELKKRVGDLKIKVDCDSKDLDQLKQYTRRDLLEIHGVPFSRHENTNAIVLKIAEIVAPDLEIDEHEISTSHRLPTANSDFIPPIMVKFTRRDTRDRIYNSKRRLKSKKASDLGLGFTQYSKLYVNESLTKKSKELTIEESQITCKSSQL